MSKIPINEFFSTIQGEATFTGTPAFFIRTQECPVGCSFCDTKYTWDLFCQIETSGTFEIKTSNNTWVTLSPKLGKSIKGGLSPLKSSFKRADEIKYPIGKIQDVLNLKDLIDK